MKIKVDQETDLIRLDLTINEFVTLTSDIPSIAKKLDAVRSLFD